jgi:uncharacterized protein YbcV (DUF1398 family)
MDQKHATIMQECATLSLAGKITFPDVVRKLAEIGVERYHADYTRHEITYYLPDGDSLVVTLPHHPQPTAGTFSATGIESAIRLIQRGEIVYSEFVRQTMAAGCVGYFVQITGRCAQYFGRNGEVHVEPFPAKP